ncbi:hypothetical protein ACOME3_001199 [Neoechinorhynchus agilis]
MTSPYQICTCDNEKKISIPNAGLMNRTLFSIGCPKCNKNPEFTDLVLELLVCRIVLRRKEILVLSLLLILFGLFPLNAIAVYYGVQLLGVRKRTVEHIVRNVVLFHINGILSFFLASTMMIHLNVNSDEVIKIVNGRCALL